MNKSYSVSLTIALLINITANAQTISGSFPSYKNQIVVLKSFVGFEDKMLGTATADELGNFKITFGFSEYGMAFLSLKDSKPYFITLSGEDIVIEGGTFDDPNSILCAQGKEQKAFIQYAVEHPKREQAISAWRYLQELYDGDSLFSIQAKTQSFISKEKERIEMEDEAFIESLPARSYVHWYLPLRSLVSSVSTVARYLQEEIPQTIATFRQIDYSDQRLWHSGLLKDAIDSHYWLLENMGQPLDTVYVEMNKSTDRLIESLEGDEEKFNEITDYLFDLLERHSLFDASEYLALKALTQGSCTLDENLAKQLETYRTMKKGNTAPDIAFTIEGTKIFSNSTNATKLSELESDYKLIVFGASWCPKCSEEVPKMASLYPKWKENGMEVVFISLDDVEEEFTSYSQNFPFLSYCDLKKWDSPVAENYYVFSTPTLFLLNANHKILLRPHSVKQVDAWVDWYLIEGNPFPNRQ
ncbi:MAG: thioredoxin family protein [Bacteroidota bacterium]